jgi:hypothetical protein
VHPWTRSPPPNGAAWVRAITDDMLRPLGFVRLQRSSSSWLFWLRRTRLDVFETDDAAHLMSVSRSWTMLRVWDVHDAEDRHIGRIYPKALIGDAGQILGSLEANESADSTGSLTAAIRRTPDAVEIRFAASPDMNPFLRMLILGAILIRDPAPS